MHSPSCIHLHSLAVTDTPTHTPYTHPQTPTDVCFPHPHTYAETHTCSLSDENPPTHTHPRSLVPAFTRPRTPSRTATYVLLTTPFHPLFPLLISFLPPAQPYPHRRTPAHSHTNNHSYSTLMSSVPPTCVAIWIVNFGVITDLPTMLASEGTLAIGRVQLHSFERTTLRTYCPYLPTPLAKEA